MKKQEFMKYLRSLNNDSFKDLPCTPFYREFDPKIGFGFHGGNIYVLTGKPGCGKTTLALQIASYMAKGGFKTLYYSIAQRPEELISKCVSRYSYKLDFKKAATVFNLTEEDTKPIDKFFEDVKDNLEIVDATAGRATMELLTSSVKDFKPKVLFFDCLDLIPNVDMDRYITELQTIARQYNIPVIIVCDEINGMLEYVSSVIVKLKSYKELDNGVRVMELELLKNRLGNNQPTYLAYKAPYNAFISVSNPEFFDYSDKALSKRVE